MPYIPGDHLVICDQCGFQRYASECRMQWDNLFTCPECFDEKHPQYKPPTGLHEKQTVDIRRPETEPVFLEPGDVTPEDL